MARLIYRGPLLMGRNARYRVNGVDGNTFDIALTAKLSGHEDVFKMFPFSTKYGGVDVRTDESAGEHHTSANKNQWITSDLTMTLKRLRITYPTQQPAAPAPAAEDESAARTHLASNAVQLLTPPGVGPRPTQ
jgi:hypothetical protein